MLLKTVICNAISKDCKLKFKDFSSTFKYPGMLLLSVTKGCRCWSNLFAVDVNEMLFDNGVCTVLGIKRQKPKP